MLFINIPADGLFLAILKRAKGDLSLDNVTCLVETYVKRYLECKPDGIFLNVCYRRSLTPSKVFDSYLYNIETDENGFAVRGENGETVKTRSPISEGISKYFQSFFLCARVLLEKGIDIYKTAVDVIRSAGCKVFLSVRMNDGHYTHDPGVNSSFAMKDGGRHTLRKDGCSLDFSQKAVQTYFLEYIKELIQYYPVDGIELDWLRYPGVLPQKFRGDYTILNGYMAAVRKLLDSYNKELSVAVRVLSDEQTNLGSGVDVCQWIADGSAQILTIENFYVPTNFEMPVRQWRSSIHAKNTENRNYALLCGSDWAVSCTKGYDVPMNPALVRGFTSDCIYRGADGVYLFNFFEEDEDSSRELIVNGTKPVLRDCFAQRIRAAKESQALPRRYVHMGLSNSRYPITLGQGEVYSFCQHIEKPFKGCTLTVGCDGNVKLEVCVNQRDLTDMLEKEPIFPGFSYIPPEELGKTGDFVYSISQIAPAVLSVAFPQGLLVAEDFRISIRNTDKQTAKLLWLEVSCQGEETF